MRFYADSLGLGNRGFAHAQKEERIQPLGLLVGQLGKGGIQLSLFMPKREKILKYL